MIRIEWPTNDRKMPTQNTSSECCPHMMAGCTIGDSRPFQSRGMKRVIMNAMITKWITR